MHRERWLLLDADDTLWENNVYFEQAIEQFVGYVDHPTLTSGEVRAALDEVEARNIKLRGYGTDNFARNLVETFELLRRKRASDAERRHLCGLTDRIRNCPIELIEDVSETLDQLARRYRLGLVTKGDEQEQRSKLDRSGLRRHFDFVRFAPEKDAACYRDVIRETGADPASTWMVGNSPKSDINPALEAGLGAVLIPNGNTWSLEMQALPERHARFRTLDRFADLLSVF